MSRNAGRGCACLLIRFVRSGTRRVSKRAVTRPFFTRVARFAVNNDSTTNHDPTRTTQDTCTRSPPPPLLAGGSHNVKVPWWHLRSRGTCLRARATSHTRLEARQKSSSRPCALFLWHRRRRRRCRRQLCRAACICRQICAAGGGEAVWAPAGARSAGRRCSWLRASALSVRHARCRCRCAPSTRRSRSTPTFRHVRTRRENGLYRPLRARLAREDAWVTSLAMRPDGRCCAFRFAALRTRSASCTSAFQTRTGGSG